MRWRPSMLRCFRAGGVVAFGLWLSIGAALAQMPGDADCDMQITEADVAALGAALFGESDCLGADVNEDFVVSAADLPALRGLLNPPVMATATDGATTTPTPTPTASATMAMSPTPTLAACPAEGAELRLSLDDRTDGATVDATIEGRRIGETCRNTNGLAETYEAAAGVTPQMITGLAPGVWVHSITVDNPPTGQQQHRSSLLLANTSPNTIAFTAFASVFTVRSNGDVVSSDSLRDALNWAGNATKPALIQFDELVFPSGTPTVITLTGALPKLTSGDVTIDGLDANGAAGFRIIDAARAAIPALAINGGSNAVIGLGLRNAGGGNRDVVSISGAAARGNLIDRCIIENAETGDGIGIDNGAGAGFDDSTTVVRDTQVTGASDKGIKVTTGAYARLENNWVHDNVNGGIQATLSGHVFAVDNLVERNRGGSAQNGMSANGAYSETTMVPSELRTDGNVARSNAANGIAVLGFSIGVLSNDYLAGNGSSGLRVYNRQQFAAYAEVQGMAAVCNGVDGAVVTDSSGADFGGSMSPGYNAFTQNNLPGGGANLRNATGKTLHALNNQWEHCGRETECNDVDIAAYDLSDHGVHTLFAPAQAQRAERAPIVNGMRPAKAAAGDVVRVLGHGFNAIDGHAAGETCTDVATRNRCVPLRGNCVLIGGVPAPIEALTPTMLVVRMPFACVEPVSLTVQTQGGGTSAPMTVCTNDGM